MFPLLPSDLPDRPALQGLVLSQMHVIDKRLVPSEHPHLALFAVRACARHERRRLFHVSLEGWASGRVPQLRLALFQGPYGGLIPRWQLVEKPDRLQGELELGRHAEVDREYRGLTIAVLR